MNVIKKIIGQFFSKINFGKPKPIDRFYCFVFGINEPFCKCVIPLNEFQTNEIFQGTHKECKDYVYMEIMSYFDGDLPNSVLKYYHRKGYDDVTITRFCKKNIFSHSPKNIDQIEDFVINLKYRMDKMNKNVIINIIKKEKNERRGIIMIYGINKGICIEFYYILLKINDINKLISKK